MITAPWLREVSAVMTGALAEPDAINVTVAVSVPVPFPFTVARRKSYEEPEFKPVTL